MRKLIRMTVISSLLVSVVVLALASTGGGEKKKNNDIPLKNEFVPIRTINNFTLKAGPSYRGSIFTGEEKTREYVSINTLITYQKGNSIFIIPYTYKSPSLNLNGGAGKSNLQLLDVRIKMHK